MANPHPVPFKKTGAAANPNGRPKKAWTMAGLIEQALEEVEPNSGKSYKQLVAKRLAHMAVSGDMQAIKEINDRVDGRAKQQIEHGGMDGEPIKVVIEDYTT